MFKSFFIKTIFIISITVLFCPFSFAGQLNRSVGVTTKIPQLNTLKVTVSKVKGSMWMPVTTMNFGTFVFDPKHNIFTSDSYYAVDVGISSNSPSWTLTHRATSFTNGTETLDNNINVTFVSQLDKKTGSEIEKVSLAKSLNKTFSKTQIGSGWLRIYYGLATGDEGKDAPDTKPVSTTGIPGGYKGTINFTLSP